MGTSKFNAVGNPAMDWILIHEGGGGGGRNTPSRSMLLKPKIIAGQILGSYTDFTLT